MALALAAAGAVGILRRRKSCSLWGARAQWRLLLTIAVIMVLVYAALYSLTTWLGRLAS